MNLLIELLNPQKFWYSVVRQATSPFTLRWGLKVLEDLAGHWSDLHTEVFPFPECEEIWSSDSNDSILVDIAFGSDVHRSGFPIPDPGASFVCRGFTIEDVKQIRHRWFLQSLDNAMVQISCCLLFSIVELSVTRDRSVTSVCRGLIKQSRNHSNWNPIREASELFNPVRTVVSGLVSFSAPRCYCVLL